MKNKAAQQLGRLGGKVSTEAKAAAARENGAKGGRPGLYAYACQTNNGDGWITIGRAGNRAQAQEEAKRQRQWLRDDSIDPRGRVRVARFRLGS